MLALNVPVERAQIYGNAATSPWALKPMVGVFSDTVVLGGRRKKFVLVFVTICGVVGAVVLSIGISVELVVVFGMFLLSLQSSSADLLTVFTKNYSKKKSNFIIILFKEAKYSEIMRTSPSSSSAITVFVNGSQRFGYVVAFVAVGPLLASGYFRLLFLLTVGCCTLMLVPVLLNFLPEPLVARTAGMIGCKHFLIDWPKIKSEWKMLLLIVICGVLSVGLSVLPVVWKSVSGLIVSTVLFFVITIAFIVVAYFVFPSKYIARV
jgi:hypothetical protein